MTHHIDESFGIYFVSERAGIFNPNHYFESDLNVNITIDYRSKTAIYSQYESNFRQISVGDYRTHQIWEGVKEVGRKINNFFNVNDDDRGSQPSGITFTSEFTFNGDGPKTDATHGSQGSVNLDGILAAFTAAGQRKEALKFTRDDIKDWADLFSKNMEALKGMNEKRKKDDNSSLSSSPTNSSNNTKSKSKYHNGYMVIFDTSKFKAGTIVYSSSGLGNLKVNSDGTGTIAPVEKATDTLPQLKKKK